MFPHIFYGAFQGLDNVLYKAFTLFRQGIYKVFQCFLQGLYKVFNVVLQGFYNAVARLPQVVYNACYKFFTRRLQSRLQGSYDVFYIAFTMFFYIVCTMLVCEAFTFLFVAKVLQDCYNAFIRLLQGFNKVLTTFSRYVLHCFYKAFRGFQKAVRRLLESF